MQATEVKSLIENDIPDSIAIVNSNDNVHFDAIVVSSTFEGLSKIKRQKRVYQSLGTLIPDGEIHALSLKTYTLNEWKSEQENG